MAKQSLLTEVTANDLVVNRGTAANSKNGDPLRTAFRKVNESIARADANFTELYNTIAAGGVVQVNADWNATTGMAQILNKPFVPDPQVHSDWNAVSGLAQILNKPTIPAAYTLPTATTTVLGGVKVDGSSITINPEGIISVSGGAPGGGSYDQSLNTTDSVTFTGVTVGKAQQQGTQYVSVGGTPNPVSAVIFTAPMWMTSIKLVISVEGNIDGDMTYVDHTQTCEATISAIYNTSAEPVISVYGLTHTSVTPLATFNVQRGAGNSIEVVATNTQANNPLHVKVHAINFVSYFN